MPRMRTVRPARCAALPPNVDRHARIRYQVSNYTMAGCGQTCEDPVSNYTMAGCGQTCEDPVPGK